MSTDKPSENSQSTDAVGSRALSEELGAWLPIETAPRDGTVILTTGHNGGRRVIPALWADRSESEHWSGPDCGWIGFLHNTGQLDHLAVPTLWQPLPEAPNVRVEPA